MKTSLRITILVVIITILVSITALAASYYQVDWWSIDGGGGTSQGGDYTLRGTIGQFDAGSSQGGDYTQTGGFWAGIVHRIRQFFIHLPLVLK